MTIEQFRLDCAAQLESLSQKAAHTTAFVGLDGFVDDILRVVDKRQDAERFTTLGTIKELADRFAAAAGHSTNIEIVRRLLKLGGNGPIMANALASFGVQVSYLGCLGYPKLHPVFDEFAQRAAVSSIAEPGYTDALEFDDGKIMVGKHFTLKEVNWPNIVQRYGREKFAAQFSGSDFIGFVNWTMLPCMSDIWAAIQHDLCPTLKGPKRTMFFDLADPEKRTAQDIQRALELITAFGQHFNVILGLNEKETHELGKVFGLRPADGSRQALADHAMELSRRIPVSTLVVHPVAYALAVSAGKLSVVEGSYVARPLITTGAGDHFNAGFCLGKLLGLADDLALLTGVTTSGFYVRTAQSPSVNDLAEFMRHWPSKEN